MNLIHDTHYSVEIPLDPVPHISQLLRPARYVGTVEEVHNCGAHRLLLLRELCGDDRTLAVWLSSVAIEAPESLAWRHLLAPPTAPGTKVRFWGRFRSPEDVASRLTADVHYPEHVWIDVAKSRQSTLQQHTLTPPHATQSLAST